MYTNVLNVQRIDMTRFVCMCFYTLRCIIYVWGVFHKNEWMRIQVYSEAKLEKVFYKMSVFPLEAWKQVVRDSTNYKHLLYNFNNFLKVK